MLKAVPLVSAFSLAAFLSFEAQAQEHAPPSFALDTGSHVTIYSDANNERFNYATFSCDGDPAKDHKEHSIELLYYPENDESAVADSMLGEFAKLASPEVITFSHMLRMTSTPDNWMPIPENDTTMSLSVIATPEGDLKHLDTPETALKLLENYTLGALDAAGYSADPADVEELFGDLITSQCDLGM